MPTNILIIEDEPVIADDLEATLLDLDYEVADVVDNGEDAMLALSNDEVDLILMDISIDGDMDGIELAIKINENHQIPIIFLTSFYDKSTLNRAKKTNPAGYIVKPFEEKNLIANIEIALAKIKKTPLLSQNNFSADKFFIRENNDLLSINLSDINWIEAYNNYSYIYTDKDKYLISHTLKSIDEKLTGKGFVRVHRSFLVNFNKITLVSEGYVFVKEEKIPLGKSHRQDFYKKLELL